MVDNNFKKEYDNGMDSSFYIPFGSQGHPTSAFSPNQIAEMGLRLNAGLKNVEAGPVEARVFEQIPKQHYEEMRRLSKLTEANPSFHAPLVDPAGFQQNQYREGQREQMESQLKDVIERAHTMWVNPKTGEPIDNKPIRVNMHSANDAQAFLFSKEEDLKFYDDNDEKNRDKNYVKVLGFVNQIDGKVNYIQAQEKYAGEKIEGVAKFENPWEKIKEDNEELWERQKLALRSREHERLLIQERMNNDAALLETYIKVPKKLNQAPEKYVQIKEVDESGNIIGSGKRKTEDIASRYVSYYAEEKAREEERLNQSKQIFDLYLKFYEPKDREEKENYNEVKSKYAEMIRRYEQQKQFEREQAKKLSQELRSAKDPIDRYMTIEKAKEERDRILNENGINPVSSEEFTNLIETLDTPQVFKPVEDFALDKSAKTFSNVALHAIDQAKGDYSKAPVITIENWTPELPFSRGESLKKLVDKSREELVEKLKKERGFTETEAKKAAESVLGATWDVGHIYQLKKYGFDKEDVVKETEKIAGSLKHVHLTDNFGYSDSHLALGMGTVPIKEMLEKIKEAGYKDKYIIEAGAFAGEFKTSPVLYSAENLNSPVYTYSDNNPTWEATRDIYQSYFPGFGDILPETHFRQLYGSGFSQLPKELGGPQQGDSSRFSGNPLT